MAQKKTKIVLWALVVVLLAVAIFIILQLRCGKVGEDEGRLDIERRVSIDADAVKEDVKPREEKKAVPVKKRVNAPVKKQAVNVREKPDAIVAGETKVEKKTKQKKKKDDFDDHPVNNVPSF